MFLARFLMNGRRINHEAEKNLKSNKRHEKRDSVLEIALIYAHSTGLIFEAIRKESVWDLQHPRVPKVWANSAFVAHGDYRLHVLLHVHQIITRPRSF